MQPYCSPFAVTLWPERVHEQRAARVDGDVLTAVDRVRHRAGRHLAADARLPQLRAGARIEREEIAFAAAGEYEIAGGRQDPAVGDVGHLELPFQLARLRIERLNRTPPFLRRALVDVAGPGAERGHCHRGESSRVLVPFFGLS